MNATLFVIPANEVNRLGPTLTIDEETHLGQGFIWVKDPSNPDDVIVTVYREAVAEMAAEIKFWAQAQKEG